MSAAKSPDESFAPAPEAPSLAAADAPMVATDEAEEAAPRDYDAAAGGAVAPAEPMAAPMSPPPPPPAATPMPASRAPARAEAAGMAGLGSVAKMGAPPSRPTATVARPDERMPLMIQSASVKAGEWDDNANYREFQKWLRTEESQPFRHVDISDRQFIVVRDADGKAVPNCPVTVSDADQHRTTLTTTASGRVIFFPHAEGLSGRAFSASTSCQQSNASARFSLDQSDSVIDLKLSQKRVLPKTIDVDVAFILDTTGSMSEEIAAVKATIQKVASSLSSTNVRVRIGLVEYKDRSDHFVTRAYPMTTDLNSFSRQVSSINASGGGDTPEAANEGLSAGLTKLSWNSQAAVRLAFLIADAPPHLDYQDDVGYERSMKDAAHRGIQLYTIAASGMDDLGQVVFRQVAQYTGATNLFVLRGGAGPQSTGGGDPKSSCGGTQTAYRSGNLDALIVRKVEQQVRALDRDPLKIPGVGRDENAKPCAERLMLAE